MTQSEEPTTGSMEGLRDEILLQIPHRIYSNVCKVEEAEYCITSFSYQFTQLSTQQAMPKLNYTSHHKRKMHWNVFLQE